MRTHPYLRAYMAGIAGPTLFLLVIMMGAGYLHVRFDSADASIVGMNVWRLERAVLFPMAIVPNLWGLWNMLYLRLRRVAPRWPLGVHGALLVPLLACCGVAFANLTGVTDVRLTAVRC